MTSRRLLPALLTVLVTAVLAACAAPAAGPRTAAEVHTSGAVQAGGGAQAPSSAGAAPSGPDLIRAWDAARSRAWARGDPRQLRALYVPDSRAGRHDRAMLRAWVSRGLRIRGLRTQLISVRELARTATTRTLAVTDRLVGGVVVGRAAGRPLPRDGPSTRAVRLRLLDGRWLVAGVRPLTTAG